MTIYFFGGPADGKNLMLRRAPALLRVTTNRLTLEIDGLDQPGDEPEPVEDVHVYKLRGGKAGRVHLCYRGKNRAASGWYATGEYDFLVGCLPAVNATGVGWTLLAEELAAVNFPDLLAPDILAAARDRIAARSEREADGRYSA